ncbi:putative bifunctional diguanylate cyclase/phosphodiesterase [Vibrio aestuarianus]|uniref:putative bifunctional diguanylate cyclase/phosphodiesterase n=1 Tax=Vibrio aestuarianus TaxID=28171 RepID=UPI00237D15CC|nr:EAL domain-containing protein [Vibrio aestuarianus]MDE1328778.1 EAL domain-containing protein [Vibrio aestuarianus]
MKLNNRILLLIAPVILLSAAASSYIIYSSQKDALLKREESYLQLSMEKLAGLFRQTHSLVNSYAYTLTKSDIIRHYVAHEKNPYRELELVDNFQQTLDILQSREGRFVALSILDGSKNVLYYAENSIDPFATIDKKVLNYVQDTFNHTQKISDISYITNSSGEGILVRYDVLDKKTLAAPLSYNRDQIFFVVVFAALEQFDQLRKQIEFDNQSTIFFSENSNIDKIGLTQTVELKPGLYATLDPAQFLINNKLNIILKRLALSFGTSAFVTVFLLLFLLYRHVIKPISQLDKQLKEVENKQRDNIETLDTKDEIGRLSSRFYDMYQELDTTYKKTKALAEYDHLTKLANRHHFKQSVERVLSNARYNDNIWVLYIDLDNFKYVNDKYGHQVGDTLLVNFAQHVRSLSHFFYTQYQVKNLAARLSGDEFSIFISAPSSFSQGATEFATQLLAPIQNQSNSPLGNFPITASIGIATYPFDGNTLEKLLLNADTAMYQAKNAGKNQIAYYSPDLDKGVQRRATIEQALRLGDFEREFSLVYQPYLNRNGNTIAGVEVLLRWESKQLGLVSPKEFIPIAEQTGLFGSIDRWVIRSAFKEFHALQAISEHPVQVSINLSSAELNTLQLAHYIHKHAQENAIPPHLIDFEITETFAANSKGFPLLHELSHLGYGLAIDDFGSGYTSITQLVQYPVQKIKFDRLFLDTLIVTNNQKVIKPLIDLCHSQSMLVAAEGIENQEMHHWLAGYHCDYMQGYYFAKPMTLNALTSWYKQQKELSLTYEKRDHCLS